MRKCTHCASEHTPQWRKGPMGPKTLCNACGVRYKSGRLAPEYRPAASPTFTPTQHSNSHQKVLELQQQNERSSSSSFLSEGVRKCTHSASERTLQWRIGPMGPKTLCNACGVWYNSGRLAPEYRPAASPTFTPTQHSNSHQKVLELQQQNEREEVNCHDDFHDHNQQKQQQHDFKMATVTRSSRKLKDDDNSSPKSKHLSDKGSTTLGSMATDTSGLRRSARETPSKKQSVSSPSSKRKSERIEKRMPPTPPIQRKPERVLKQRTPSPLKSSDRLENHLSSSSSGSKKPGKSLSPSSSPLITEKKKEKIEKNEKQPMENGIDERENEEKSRRPIRIVFKKNRMDARSYKQLLLKAKERKAQKSDEKLKSHDLLSQGETDNTEAIGSKEVADEAECSGRKGGELRGEESGEGCEGSGEESSSGSEKLNTDRPSNHEETEPWHSDRIRKDPPEEGHDCDNKVGPPLSKYSNNFLQSSPRLVAEERVGNAAGAKLGCSGSETLQKPVVMESISEGRSVSCDHDLGKAHSVGSSKRNRKVEDLDFDASATPTSKEIPVSNDAVCSSPAEKNAAKQCVACSKRRRLDYNSLENTCFCNCKKFIDLCGTAPPEEVHKQAAVLVSPQNDQSPMHCILNDGNKDDRDQIDGKQLEVGHLTVVQRETVQDRDELCITVEISNCSDEDGREMRSRDSDIPIEEHSNMELRGPTDTQTESDHNAYVISKPGGKILYCDGNGCKKRYHMDYLDPPLEAFPLGNWHCFSCVQKKVESGVHSVSGVEAIWDVREEEVFDGKGMYKEKQYFVQYRGLAHVHNRWIPEKQLLAEAPVLVTNFKKNQGLRWKSEWLKPYRLLQKRMLMSPRQRDKCFGEDYSSTLNCHYEWLVKWSGLGFEHATWELENSPVFKSPEARTLIEEYERRRQKAKRASDTSVTVKERKGSFFQLSKLPCNGPPGLENCHLSFVNKLREYQHKCQNAVVFEDQERFMKVILFMLSMEADARRPLLVITTLSSLAAWEAEFARIAPSFGVVAYGGNKDVRKIIRAVEFFEEGGCVMFEVLLSTPDVVVEDLEFLECIGWESIVVDECQRSTVSRHFEVIKRLTTDFKLLLFSGQIKDSIAEYLNLLCFVDSRSEENDVAHLSIDSSDTLNKVKDKFSRFIASERKLEPKFLEYWVPARLSSKQLEKYCGTLLLNLITLRSCSKHDPVGALREILISCRKCCDHPYIVDEHLQAFVTKDLPEIEYLDIGIKASGKLQLFDKILQEIKQRGLRVLVLFQSISGAGRNGIGDILDDFLRQRFGPDSYERVEYGLVSAKKNAALNMFNNKQRGRFAFLLETRACLPSIKLSSVDVVILFDSDWNPLNDLRCLQKITIDSQYEHIKVFRLYSSCTVEEKVLILAKKLHLDSNIQSMNPTTSHTLLMWGASYLFKKLEEFHGGSSISAMQQSFLNDVVQEFSSQLPSNADNNTTSECSLISKAQQSGATYSKNIYLLGELEMQSRDEESPHIFWTNLLEGRYPRWRYSSGSSQRVRKKVHYFDESPKRPQVIENDEGVKKRRKVVSSTTDDPKSSIPLIEDNGKDANARKEGTSGTSASNGSQNLPKSISDTKSMNHIVANGIDQPEVNIAEVDERGTLRHSQKNLLISLKPEISRLCEVLQLPEDVKHMTRTFLEYIMNNHHVSREPATILQAFLISLCWSAASLLRHKINRKESLALAKQHLEFECKEEETQSIYSKLKAMKKRFRRQGETVPSNSIDCSAPNMNEVEKDNIHARASQSVASSQQDLEEGEIRDSSQSRNCSNQQGSDKQGHAPNSKLAKELSKCEFSSSIKQVKKTYRNRMRKIYQKQMDDSEIFKDKMEKTKAGLEKNHKFDYMLIRTLYSQMSVRLDKLKVTDKEFERKIEEFNLWKETEWGKLLSAQEAQRNEEKEMKARWLEEAKCGRPVATYVMLPMSSSGFRVEEMEDFNQDRVGHENATTLSATSADIQDPNGNMLAVPGKTIPAERPYTLLDKRIEVGVPAEVPPVVPSTVSYNEAEVNVSTGQPSSISNKVSEIEVQVNVSTDPSPVVSNIVTENEVVVNGCNDLQPAALECGAVNNENDTGVLEQEITTESPQQTKTRLGSLDGGNSSSLERMQTDSPLPQQHVTPAEDSQVLSPQVPAVEQPQSSVSARAQAEDVSSCEVQSSSQVELTPPQPDHDIPLDQSNDDVPVQQPTEVQTQSLADLPGCTLNSQMELPPSVDPQLDVPACTINSRTELPPSIDLQLDVPACTLDLRTELLPSIDSQLDVPACTLDLRTELPSSIDPQLDVPACTLNSRTELPPSIDPQLDIPACTLNSQLGLPSSTGPQLEVPACSLINNGQSDGGHTSLQLTEGQIQPPANHSSIPPNMQLPLENQSRPTPSQLTEGTVRLSAQGHIDLFSVSRPGPQLQLHLPTDSFVSGTGNRSSNLRSVGVITESIQRPPSAPTARVASRVSQQFLVDPLQHELTRITRESEQASKMHEDLKMRLSSQCEKEIEEIRMKYKAMLQDAEVSFIQKRKEHEVSFHKIHMNRVLAEAFRIKFSETKTGSPSPTPGGSAGFVQQLLQVSPLQNPQRTTVSPGPSVASPPVQAVSNASALFSNPVRPHLTPSISPSGHHQVGSEIRAPAPHLQPFRPTTSMSVAGSGSSSHIMSQLSPCNPTSGSMPPHLTPRTPTYTSVPFSRGHQTESTYHNSSFPALELPPDIDNRTSVISPNPMPPLQDFGQSFNTWDMSDLSMAGSARTTAVCTSTAADNVVCLSDDD